jgi:Ser/Thr protein kinase RdoA (MazF antagonist)
VLDAAHRALAVGLERAEAPRLALDATAGNGHDTLLLAERVGEGGRVVGFDVQAAAIEATRARLAAAGPVDMGPIHGDLVRENVLVQDGSLALIDFDDCGPGYRLLEIATILHPNRDEPDYPALRDAVLEGYGALRPLSDAALALLPVLQFLRAASYVGWIMSRREVPGMAARERRFIERACALAGGV